MGALVILMSLHWPSLDLWHVPFFTGVQNTTHIKQETDQNHGKFKSSLHHFAQILLNELHCEYRVKQQQHNNDPCNIPALSLPSLNHSHYGDSLSGQAADEERGFIEIPPVFCNAFSEQKNKHAWESCSAVPCMRKPVMHRSV